MITNMKKQISLLFIVILVTAAIDISKIDAADYTQRFSEPTGNTSVVPGASARSPLRTSTGADDWVVVTSKSNQPREIGTSPHQGTDLRADATRAVYPILPGKVKSIEQPSTTSQMGTVILQHDVDGDGIYDDYYVRYTHIVPKSGIVVNQIFNVTTSIGAIDKFKTFGPHLHFQSVNSSNSLTFKMFNFYRTVSSWDNGSLLDYITNMVISSNVMTLTAYSTHPGTGTGPQVKYNVNKVELYYKVGSSGTWQKSTTNFSVESSTTYKWKINLKTATGANTGDVVYYYIVAHSGDPTFSSGWTYRYGFYPQYFEHPTPPLSASNANASAKYHLITPY